jgi:hypothetical protein
MPNTRRAARVGKQYENMHSRGVYPTNVLAGQLSSVPSRQTPQRYPDRDH